MLQDGDRLIRIINRNNQNRAGIPRRSGFKTKNWRMSVFLERLLVKPALPRLTPETDILVFIPFEWISDPKKTIHSLSVEHDRGAHFEIVGEISIFFADILRVEAPRIAASEWVRIFKPVGPR